MNYNKQFLIIGNATAISYKEVFPLIKRNELWWGVTPRGLNFKLPDGSYKSVNAVWYTNLHHGKRHERLNLFKYYLGNESDYTRYDNYNAIEVNKVKNIPIDYDGFMGVPITFFSKYNPEQFEIIDANKIRMNSKTPFKQHGLIKDNDGTISGKPVYVRIVIRNRNPVK